MKDHGGDDACRNGKDSAPSPVRENAKRDYHQDGQYRKFGKDPGHGSPFLTRLTGSDYTTAPGIDRQGRSAIAIGNADMIEDFSASGH
jgi:hypothetical protein